MKTYLKKNMNAFIDDALNLNTITPQPLTEEL